mmetsp:Transcript_9229/g.13139  ORF Transcript_9229/g.13139 Transcript_9229/m.13139 type:complete len:403 (-) Transcript_9229:4589-5797(-)
MASGGTSSTKVPRRALGQVHGNEKLASTSPIVGLGCSSFSNFFFTDEEKAAEGDKTWGPETVDLQHPRVKEWIAAIRCGVVEFGINLLDTAPWYGCSETVVGFAVENLKENDNVARDDLIINTKVGRDFSDPRQFDFSYDKIISSVQRSLQRLKCGYINVLQLHDPEFAQSVDQLFDETIPAMLECQKKGWCKALGMTGYPLEVQHEILQRSLKEKIVWDQSLVYGHFNLHNTSLFSQPNFDGKSFATFINENEISLAAAAPLSMGLLTHRDPPDWHPAPNVLKQACKVAASICQSRGVNISALATLVALSNPRISYTLIGVRNRDEVERAANAACRFIGVTNKKSEEALQEVLNAEEYEAWQVLQDHSTGPFAHVWENGGYKWDGVQYAKDFWKEMEEKEN